MDQARAGDVSSVVSSNAAHAAEQVACDIPTATADSATSLCLNFNLHVTACCTHTEDSNIVIAGQKKQQFQAIVSILILTKQVGKR